MTTPAINADPGDWIIYTAGTRDPNRNADNLGGPWQVGKLLKITVSGWTVLPKGDTPAQFIERGRIKRVFLTRGEALLTLRDLNNAVAEYIETRDTLKPRYQTRVDGLLLP